MRTDHRCNEDLTRLKSIGGLFVCAAVLTYIVYIRAVPKLAPPEPPNRRGLAQKGGPVNSHYVVLFTQRMIKVP